MTWKDVISWLVIMTLEKGKDSHSAWEREKHTKFTQCEPFLCI